MVKTSYFRKVLSLFLAFMMVITSFVFVSADAASSTVNVTYALYKNNSVRHDLHWINGTNTPLYCVEQGKKSYKGSYNKTKDGNQNTFRAAVGYFGFGGELGGKLSGSWEDKAFATQYLLWALNDEGLSNKNINDVTYRDIQVVYDRAYDHWSKSSTVDSIMDDIMSHLKAGITQPWFSTSNLILKYNKSANAWVGSITDQNGTLTDTTYGYRLDTGSLPSGVTAKVSGNKITITSKKANTSVNLKFVSRLQDKGDGLYTLTRTNTQKLVVGDYFAAPNVTLKATSEKYGAAKLTKVAEVITADNKTIKLSDKSGFKFQLTGGNLTSPKVGTTDKNGNITFNDLVPGTYKLTEITNSRKPEDKNFAWDATGTYRFPIQGKSEPVKVQAGQTATITMTNTLQLEEAVISVKKVDGSLPLEGAELTLYDYGPDGKAETSDDIKVSTKVSGKDGIVEWKSVDQGGVQEFTVGHKYYVKETKAPTGYVLVKDIKDFGVVDWGHKGTNPLEFQNTAYGKIKIHKTDEDTGNNVAGAEYTIIDSENEEQRWVLITDENGFAETTEPLACNKTYYIRETKAAPGYLLDTTVHEVFLKPNEEEKVSTLANKVEVDLVNSGAITEASPLAIQVFADPASGIANPKLSDFAFTITDKEGNDITADVLKEGEMVTDMHGIVYVYASKMNQELYITPKNGGMKAEVLAEGETSDYNVVNEETQTVKALYNVKNGVIRYVLDSPEEAVGDSGVAYVQDLPVINDDFFTYGTVKATVMSGKKKLANSVVALNYGVGLSVSASTDKNGVAIFEHVPVGLPFTIMQTDAPLHYKSDEMSQEIMLTEAGETKAVSFTSTVNDDEVDMSAEVSLEVTDKAITVTLSKEDLTTGKKVPGATITVYFKDSEDPDGLGDVFYTGVTNENGEIVISAVPAGDYIFRETIAPDGYQINETFFEFTVNEDGSISGDTTVKDAPTEVTLYKYDATAYNFNVTPDEYALISSATTPVDYSDLAALEKTDDTEDKSEAEGSEDADVGDEENVEDAEATVQSEDVPDDNSRPAKAPAKDEEEEEEDKEEEPKTEISDVSLAGATFELYKVTTDPETGEEKADLVGTYETDENGLIKVTYLTRGRYKFIETKQPTGYVLDSTPYYFVIDENGMVDEDITVGNLETPFHLRKIDRVNNKTLAGVEFAIKDADGNIVWQGVTNENGEINIYKLAPGKYTYYEVKTLEGYVLDKSIYEFVVNEDGTTSGDITFENDRVYGELRITKVDGETGAVLEGAVFEIRDEFGTTTRATTGKDGIATFSSVPYGNYVYYEVEAPDGYDVDPTEYPFAITENGIVIEVEVENDPTLTEITIYKWDGNSGEELKGAVFAIYDENGKKLDEQKTDGDGKAVFKDLKYGSYEIKEIEAPNGYIRTDETITFTIDSNHSYSDIYDVYNFRESTPYTGAGAQILPFIFGFAALGVLGADFYLNKKTRRKAFN